MCWVIFIMLVILLLECGLDLFLEIRNSKKEQIKIKQYKTRLQNIKEVSQQALDDEVRVSSALVFINLESDVNIKDTND